jgi:hypothetical protein
VGASGYLRSALVGSKGALEQVSPAYGIPGRRKLRSSSATGGLRGELFGTAELDILGRGIGRLRLAINDRLSFMCLPRLARLSLRASIVIVSRSTLTGSLLA